MVTPSACDVHRMLPNACLHQIDDKQLETLGRPQTFAQEADHVNFLQLRLSRSGGKNSV